MDIRHLLELLSKWRANFKMDVGIVIAIITAIVSISGNVLQARLWKSQAKKEEAAASTAIGDLALRLNKQEFETIRAVNDTLELENKKLREELQVLKNCCTEKDRFIEEKLEEIKNAAKKEM